MKKLIYLTLALSLGFVSCSDYLDEPNENFTNSPESGLLSPSQKLAAAQLRFLRNETLTQNSFGNYMTYTYGLNKDFTSNGSQYTFNFSSSTFTGGPWDLSYLFIDNFQDIIDSQAQYPTYVNYVAISKILKAQGMERIIKLFGDAPYSEAFNSAILTPKYDDDKQVVKDLVLLLDDARTQIIAASSDPDAVLPGAEDIVFAGDMFKWYQYANTLELRLLLSLSETTDASLVAFRNDRFANLTLDFIAEDVTFNPGFNSSTMDQVNPIWESYGVTDIGITKNNNGWLSTVAGKVIADVLNGTANTASLNSVGVIDPRSSSMFSAANGSVIGSEHGVQNQIAKSRLALFVHGQNGNTDAGVSNGASRDAYTMLYAESLFLQAEAVERGYIAGNAQGLFNQGIDASFAFYSRSFGSVTVAPLNSAAYILASDSKNGLGWTGSADKINAIMTQKWLAITQWTGIEPYFDMNRTGYPVSPVPVGVSQTTRPNRLIYPSSEYSANSANVPSVTVNELFTVNAKTPYYVKP